jgi:hypothetical protein
MCSVADCRAGLALLLMFVEFDVEGYAVKLEWDNRAEIGVVCSL